MEHTRAEKRIFGPRGRMYRSVASSAGDRGGDVAGGIAGGVAGAGGHVPDVVVRAEDQPHIRVRGIARPALRLTDEVSYRTRSGGQRRIRGVTRTGKRVRSFGSRHSVRRSSSWPENTPTAFCSNTARTCSPAISVSGGSGGRERSGVSAGRLGRNRSARLFRGRQHRRPPLRIHAADAAGQSGSARPDHRGTVTGASGTPRAGDGDTARLSAEHFPDPYRFGFGRDFTAARRSAATPASARD